MATATAVKVRRKAHPKSRAAPRPRRRFLGFVWAALGWVPVTPLGLAVGLGLAGLIEWVAVPTQDRVLMALALCGLAVEGVVLAAVVLTALWLRVRPQGKASGSLKAEAGVPFRTGYSPGWATWNPLVRVEIRWRLPAEARAEFVTERVRPVEQVTADGRGQADAVIRRFVVVDVFHLARVRFERSSAGAVTVLPRRGPTARPDVLPQFVSGDQLGHPSGRPEGDLMEMRRYAPGDPLKLVLWKLYGRTGRLLVRTPERAVSPTEAVLAYFVAGQGDEASAGVARGLIEAGSLGNAATFGADGAPGATRNPAEAVSQVVRSVAARDQGGAGLAWFVDEGEAAGGRACILFVPSQPGAWLDRVAGALAGRPGPVRAFVGVDGLHPASRRSRLRTLLVRRGVDANSGADAADVAAVVGRLEAAGALVRVVDRTSGQIFRPDELTGSAVD